MNQVDASYTTIYSTSYDPNCALCRSGQHQQSTTTTNLLTQNQINQANQFSNSRQLLGTQQVTNNSFLGTPNKMVGQTRIISQQIIPGPTRIIQPPTPIQTQIIPSPPVQVQSPIIKQVDQSLIQQQLLQQQLLQQQQQQLLQQQQMQQQNNYIQTNSRIENSQNYSSNNQMQQVTHVHQVDHVPVVHELHHVSRSVQVVGIQEIETPWRTKVTQLEKQLIELELMVRKGGPPKLDKQTVVVEDKEMIQMLQNQVNELEKSQKEREDEIQELKNEIDRLRTELESSGGAEKVTYFENELDTWKKRFIELNREFHLKQEELMMARAELENLQNRRVTTQVITSSS